MASQSVPTNSDKRPEDDCQEDEPHVSSNQDTEPQVETYTAPDGSLRARRTTPRERQERKTTLDLGAVQQGEKEGLRSYIKRFNLMRIQIPNLPDEVAYTDFFKGLKDGSNFKFDLVRKRVATLQEAMMEAETYIQAVDLCHMGKQGDQKRSEKKEGRSQKAAPKEEKKRKDVWMADSTSQPPSKKRKEFTPYSPKYEFNKDNHTIFKEVKGRLSLEKPTPMKGDPSKRNQGKHCHFHDDDGHETNECISLKRLLDQLAEKGDLDSYIKKPKGK
ncbi:uncharacterized protein LOC110685268 [Chenopodium quinoa]|uniref:uncharacterized protein LOC110685268 n=1 Tax=Chenopodium quinoa TaxID=63459 RepID=UPI000B7847D7|nr:uncharacterized protein LOC110685268 [Chenopodium quinoa]